MVVCRGQYGDALMQPMTVPAGSLPAVPRTGVGVP